MNPIARFDDDETSLPSIDPMHQSYEAAPSKRLQLGPFTVIGLILNRTIGQFVSIASFTHRIFSF